jgi:glycosyltransferase involved in cell wall biosynthesis
MVSGNGVDIELIHSVENNSNERYDAIYVGRLYGGKGIFDLIKAWKLVVSGDKDARLVVIGGTDANEQKPHELVNELGLSNNVVFKGYVSDKEVVEYLKSAKVFVLPSKMEGWGMSVAEAITCGLPVILYSIQSLYENFSDYNGAFFVPTGDIEALAKTILHVLNLSEEQFQEIRNHALAICNIFDLPNLFAKEHELLHQVVNKATLKESTIMLQR